MDRREFLRSGAFSAVAISTPWWKFWGPQEQYVELVDSLHVFRFERRGPSRIFSGRSKKSEQWQTATASEGQSATKALRKIHEALEIPNLEGVSTFRSDARHITIGQERIPLDKSPFGGPFDAAPDQHGEVAFRAGMLVGMWDAKFGRR